ncbi:uncharacterized protein LOC135219996 isoform X1 [Macrobrachium nipponense]|uniref:uncharacterized protein LOC135219996 isoform X1 n=1 Tax=Macrobrachium nipponense TaxID=159736 RepID=UPI0030C7DE1D
MGEKPELQVTPAEGKPTGWWSWLKREFRIDKKLIPIKAVTFFFNGGVVAFLPYLVLHMQQLGITVEEIATMYAVLPLASLIGPPITGLVADKFGRYGFMFNINIILTGLFHTLLLHVPPVPKNNLSLQCGSHGHSLTWASCDSCYKVRNNTNSLVELKNCFFTCPDQQEEVSMCYSKKLSGISHCVNYNLTDEITVNGTLRSWAKKTCSHTWSELIYNNISYDLFTCQSQCPVICDIAGVQQCHELLKIGSNRTFWVYFGLRLLATFFLASAFTMLDATTLAEIKRHKGEFGKQRVLTMLGFSIIPLIAAIIIDNRTGPTGEADYMPAFYLGDAMLAISVILIARLDLEVELPQDSLTKGLKQIITRPEIDIFLLLILILGSNFGFIESYLFVFLKELNAPNYLLGLTMTVGCLTSVPMLFWADPIVSWMGRHNVFLISFIAYAVRMFGYSYIKNPWLCFPFEALEVFTYQLMWVAAATYCPILAPKGLLATMTGVAGAVHYSFGKGLGALLGGYLIAAINTSNAFKVYGVIALSGGVFYFSAYHCYLQKFIATKAPTFPEKELVVTKVGEGVEEGDSMMDYDMKIRIDIANGICRRPSTFSWKEELHKGEETPQHQEET